MTRRFENTAPQGTRSAELTALLGDAPQPDDHDGVREYLHALAAAGGAPLLIMPGTKQPFDGRIPRKRIADDRAAQQAARDTGRQNWQRVKSLAGVHLVTADADVLDGYLDRYVKMFGDDIEINVAVSLGRSRLVVVDCDTPEQLAAFLADAGAEPDTPPTVTTPGQRDPATGEWVHSDGGHFWFTLPEGAELPERPESMTVGTGDDAYAVLWGPGKYVLTPPSVRAEGSYTVTGEVHELPDWLLQNIIEHGQARAERAQLSRDRSDGDDPITAWGASITWSEILVGTEWMATGKTDSCGCETWTAPGLHASPKSATAHEPGCAQWTDSPDPPLHIWTDHDIEPFDVNGCETVTRLRAVALIHYDNDMRAAMSALDLHDEPTTISGSSLGGDALSDGTEKGCRRYPVACLDELRYPWARELSSGIARKNAELDPVSATPTLMFSGADAVNAGATDAQLADLPELSSGDIAALKLRAAAIRRDCQKQVDTLARQIAAERDGAAATPPEPITLAALLDEPDEGPTYRVVDLWPTAGRVLLAAQYKSGKSTLVGNALRSLVDGDQFLGRFDVTPVGKVVLIDTELDKRTLRRWLRDQGIANTAAVAVLSLRGAVSTFDILDPATRSDWARQLAGANVVILDCLRPVLDALGLSEDKDAGRVLVAFDALLVDLGAAEGMVVTHMGHQNERARGDSRLLDWADALWKIVRDGDDIDDDGDRHRFLSAVGRDVALPEGQLIYDAATRHLTFSDGSRKDSAARAAMPELLALVRAEPGALSKNAAETRLKDDHGIAQKAARAAIRMAITDGSLIVTRGPRNANLLSPGQDPSTSAAAEGDP